MDIFASGFPDSESALQRGAASTQLCFPLAVRLHPESQTHHKHTDDVIVWIFFKLVPKEKS